MVTNALQTMSSVAPSKLVYCRTFARGHDGTMRHHRASSALEQPARCVQLRLHEIRLRLRENLLHHAERFLDLLEPSWRRLQQARSRIILFS